MTVEPPVSGGEPVLVVTEELSIPLSELQLVFSGSTGPGGQNVNRVATRVTVRFDVAGSPSLSQEQRALLLERLAARLDRDGTLQVSAQDTRSQHRNRHLALGRLAGVLAGALAPVRSRRPTRPTAAAVERRLVFKRRRAERKEQRRSPDWSHRDEP